MKNLKVIIGLSVFLVFGAGLLWAIEASSNLEENPRVGVNENSVPSELYDSDGQPVNFKEFKGKIVFLKQLGQLVSSMRC